MLVVLHCSQTQPNVLDPNLALGLYLKIGSSNEWLYRVRMIRLGFKAWDLHLGAFADPGIFVALGSLCTSTWHHLHTFQCMRDRGAVHW